MKHAERHSSIEKALSILLCFRAERPSWGVRELSMHLGFSPATVQRVLQSLKNYGFVTQDSVTRRYQLGVVFYTFVHALKGTYPITKAGRPFLEQLMAATGETVHLNIVEGEDRVCIDVEESPQALRASMPIGSRSPLYAGASSKCLLAFQDNALRERYLNSLTVLQPFTTDTITDAEKLRAELAETAQRGYAASLGERDRGLGSLSAPVFDHHGHLVASLSLAIPEIRYQDAGHLDFCIAKLLDTARALSQVMGHAGGGAVTADTRPARRKSKCRQGANR